MSEDKYTLEQFFRALGDVNGLPVQSELCEKIEKALTKPPAEFKEGEVYAFCHKDTSSWMYTRYLVGVEKGDREIFIKRRKQTTKESGAQELIDAMESALKLLNPSMKPAKNLVRALKTWREDRNE